MSVKLMAKAWEMDLSQGEKLVLLALCDHANDDGVCYPSQEYLAQKCSMSPRSLIDQINKLKKHGILTAERRQKGGGRLANLYVINLDNFSQGANSAPAKSAPAKSACENSAHAESAPTNVQITAELPANSALSFKEEPSKNHQLEPSIIGTGVANAPTVPSGQVKKSKQANPDNVACWESYARAYRNRYGVLPAANQKTRGQVATLVRYVGKEVAPALAEYFLSHNGSWFVQCRHEFGCLLKSYQQVLTDMHRGEQMTQTKARQTENTQSNYEAAKSALAMLQAKGLA
ncbi:MAG: helix-turn-helix domain-containing protein [Snodgrassella sp.]|uniref:helix-turn-helix domain-containing protein n=1 Tax=Snodgrassella sp. TaxID=2815304 RepID=UPI0025833C78|nr:helix-turn-helix domain-containing protein [Snodgrassella sp.]MCO6514330.1 helix-turn-helix domain-containing protein [Snodgrassella sp.]MCO6520519.1 helix-turn-helix domain-containing protein [Snodgrassella sp.]